MKKKFPLGYIIWKSCSIRVPVMEVVFAPRAMNCFEMCRSSLCSSMLRVEDPSVLTVTRSPIMYRITHERSKWSSREAIGLETGLLTLWLCYLTSSMMGVNCPKVKYQGNIKTPSVIVKIVFLPCSKSCLLTKLSPLISHCRRNVVCCMDKSHWHICSLLTVSFLSLSTLRLQLVIC